MAHPASGFYCFKLGFSPRNVVANIDPTTVGFVAVIMTTNRTLSGCPAGFGDAGAVIKDVSGIPQDAGFYVSFQ